jgi:hypothetical protein
MTNERSVATVAKHDESSERVDVVDCPSREVRRWSHSDLCSCLSDERRVTLDVEWKGPSSRSGHFPSAAASLVLSKVIVQRYDVCRVADGDCVSTGQSIC